MLDDNELALRRFLREAHRVLDPGPPSFAATVAAARWRRRSPRSRWLATVATAAAVALILGGVAYFWPRPPSRLDPAAALRLAESLSNWQGPTDFLARPPGSDLLETLPRLHQTTPPTSWNAAAANLAAGEKEETP